MEDMDCERMEDKDVLHTADELNDFVELYNGKCTVNMLYNVTFRSLLHLMWTVCQLILQKFVFVNE